MQGQARTARANELIALKDSYTAMGLQSEEAKRLVQMQAEQRRESFRERFGKAGRLMAGALAMGMSTQDAMRLNQLRRSGLRTAAEDKELLDLQGRLYESFMTQRQNANEWQRASLDVIAEATGIGMTADAQTQAALKMRQREQTGMVATPEEQAAAARAAQGAQAVADVMEGFNIFKAFLQNSLPGMLAASAAALGAHLLATIASTAALNALAGAGARAAIAAGASAAAPLARGIGRAGLGGLAGAAVGGLAASGAGAMGAGSGAQTGAQLGAVIGGIAGSVIPGLGTIFGTLIGTAGGGLIGAIVDDWNATGVKAPLATPVSPALSSVSKEALQATTDAMAAGKTAADALAAQNNQSLNTAGGAAGSAPLTISGFSDLLSLVKETNTTLTQLADTSKVINVKLPSTTGVPEQRLYYSVKP